MPRTSNYKSFSYSVKMRKNATQPGDIGDTYNVTGVIFKSTLADALDCAKQLYINSKIGEVVSAHVRYTKYSDGENSSIYFASSEPGTKLVSLGGVKGLTEYVQPQLLSISQYSCTYKV